MQPHSGWLGSGLTMALPALGLRSVTLFVKEEVGFPHLDRPPEDFHGACHLGNPGDQVSGLPPFHLPSHCPELLQPDVCPSPLLLCVGGRGTHREGTTAFLCAVTKALAWYQGGPSWTPF